MSICVVCNEALRHNRRPKWAIANGFFRGSRSDIDALAVMSDQEYDWRLSPFNTYCHRTIETA
jgi:hypothetical protein